MKWQPTKMKENIYKPSIRLISKYVNNVYNSIKKQIIQLKMVRGPE